MKHLSKSLFALSTSAVIAFCSFNSGFATGADTEEKTTCTIHYDLSEEGVYIPADEDGNVPELTDIEVRPNSSEFITNIVPEREGYIFSCWSADDIVGYNATDVFRVGESDMTFKPVWVDEEDTVFHKVTFRVENDGVIDTEAEKSVPPKKFLKGRCVNVPIQVFPKAGYKQIGWKYNDMEFFVGTKVIVHDEDMIFERNLKKLYNLIYSVGDADRINGATSQTYEIAETLSTELQATDRFSRNGFTIESWHCEEDGKDYEALSTFTMPSHDVHMFPNWKPIRYVVVFKPTSSTADYIKVPGYTDTSIIAPECTVSNEGFVFGGWQNGDTIVQPGEEYVIKGAAPGLGISFKAIWNAQGSDITTTTSTSTTTTTTTTFSSSTSSTTTSDTTTSSTTSSEPSTTISYGDANCDENVDLADAILIMQSLANPNKYGIEGTDEKHLTSQGKLNGDVDPSTKGLTSDDALAIQEYLLKKIESLPLVIKEK